MKQIITIKNMEESKLNSGITEYVFDNDKNTIDDVSLNIEKEKDINIVLLNLHDGFSFNLECEENSNVNLSVFFKNSDVSIKFNANIKQNSHLNMYCADFSSGKNKSEFIINLNEEKATCDWHLASLTSTGDNKELSVSVNHNSINTFANVDNYGVCKGESKLVFSGTSYILKGSHGCKTHQNSKIMVFDLKSDAVAKPILRIDENDVEASHAAVVGKINDEHMFYLTSRGLSFNDARSLITMGYLKPILKGFFNEKYREEISSLIEGKL